jgi:hypothetical protein
MIWRTPKSTTTALCPSASSSNTNDTADITEWISQARKLFGSMNKQLLSNKKLPIDIRRRLYQAIVVNIVLWGSESWALKEANRSKLEAFHHGCLRRMCGYLQLVSPQDVRVDDVGCSRETDHERTG